MNNKTALITGASRGIGAATAELFAKSGYNVILNYNESEAQARALEQRINDNTGVIALAIQANIADETQVHAMFSVARSQFPHIDVLVNNASIAAQGLLTDVTTAEWDALFAVNVRGTFLCSREALADMIPKKRGRIVNISSIWGITGASCEVAYSATKSAIIGFTKALAKEVGPSGITVNCVAPGVIDTEMNSNLRNEDLAELIENTPVGRLGTAEEVANAVLYLASGKAGFITGQVLSPNGGFVI